MYRNFVDTVLYLSNYNKEKTIVYLVDFIYYLLFVLKQAIM